MDDIWYLLAAKCYDSLWPHYKRHTGAIVDGYTPVLGMAGIVVGASIAVSMREPRLSLAMRKLVKEVVNQLR